MFFLEDGVCPDNWKKRNIIPIPKKESQNFIKDYSSISLLPVFSKVFERIIFNFLFNYLLENNYLLNVNQVFYQLVFASHNSFPLHTKA